MAQDRIHLNRMNGGAGGLLDSGGKEKPEGRDGDKLAQTIVVVSMAIFVLTSWVMVLASGPSSLGWFAFHAPLQSLALALFTAGIVTLQPTSQPRSKAAGLDRHQLYILFLGVPSVFLGTWAVYHNKNLAGREHLVSWHGLLGFIAVLWMCVQIAVGGASVWFGGAAFGGGMKAKNIWKYHRVSGYLLFPLFVYSAHLGGQWSGFSQKNSSMVLRFLAYSIAPLLILGAVFSRVRTSKMNLSNLLRY